MAYDFNIKVEILQEKIIKQENDTFTLLQGGNGQDVERGERRPVEDHWDPESGAGISVVFPRGKKSVWETSKGNYIRKTG